MYFSILIMLNIALFRASSANVLISMQISPELTKHPIIIFTFVIYPFICIPPTSIISDMLSIHVCFRLVLVVGTGYFVSLLVFWENLPHTSFTYISSFRLHHWHAWINLWWYYTGFHCNGRWHHLYKIAIPIKSCLLIMLIFLVEATNSVPNINMWMSWIHFHCNHFFIVKVCAKLFLEMVFALIDMTKTYDPWWNHEHQTNMILIALNYQTVCYPKMTGCYNSTAVVCHLHTRPNEKHW